MNQPALQHRIDVDNAVATYLSLVIPFFNEEEMVPLLRRELELFFETFDETYEFVFVNDGSTDQTKKLLEDWAMDNKNIRLVHFVKNIGHQKALLEGIKSSTGQYIVTMDADLQDPLNVIPTMFLKASEGYEIVHAQRISRKGEAFSRKILAWGFYRIARYVFGKKIFLDVGDFRMMTRKAVKSYFAQIQNPVGLRSGIPTIQLPQALISYARVSRAAGTSKFTMRKLLDLSRSIIRE